VAENKIWVAFIVRRKRVVRSLGGQRIVKKGLTCQCKLPSIRIEYGCIAGRDVVLKNYGGYESGHIRIVTYMPKGVSRGVLRRDQYQSNSSDWQELATRSVGYKLSTQYNGVSPDDPEKRIRTRTN